MRLREQQIHSIKAVATETLGPNAKVYLFGSRTDDTRLGGDIDLYIVGAELTVDHQLAVKTLLLSRLKQRLGDQRIDLVFAPSSGEPELPIQRIARETGILL